MRHPRSQPGGFTLTDLCVSVAVLAVLAGLVLPTAVLKCRQPAARVVCSRQLRSIGQAIQMYANENKGAFPRAAYDGVGATVTEYTAPLAVDPFLPGGPGPNDVTAALFLLLRTQDMTSGVFLCPQGPYQEPWNYSGRFVSQVSNFPGRQYLGYSYINPYPSSAVAAQGFKLNVTLPSDFAIAADMNPGAPGAVSVTPTSTPQQMRAGNTANHGGDGQNVLYADGHIEFHSTPFAGMPRGTPGSGGFRDNIYTHGAGFGAGDTSIGVYGPPADAPDSVLLPVGIFSAAVLAGMPGGGPATWHYVALGSAVVFGLVVMLAAFRRGNRTPAPEQ